MSAMALGFEAFRSDAACDLSMTDRRRSCSRRLSSRRVRVTFGKGVIETSRNAAGRDRGKSRNGRRLTTRREAHKKVSRADRKAKDRGASQGNSGGHVGKGWDARRKRRNQENPG